MDDSTNSIGTENSYSKDTLETSGSEKSIIELKPKILSAIALNLQEIIHENEANGKGRFIRKDSFYSTNLPLISIEDYIKRIMKYTQMEMPTMIIAIMYIDQMCYKKKYILCLNNIYKLIISSSLISIKFNEDASYNNSFYSQVGGISLELMNRLEYELYVLMDFSLVVDYSDYQKYNSYFNNSPKLYMDYKG